MTSNGAETAAKIPQAARREFLGAVCGSSLGALLASWTQSSSAQPAADGKARSVILIFNCGGPSHIDLWDPKPLGPETVRGPYQPIDTNVPGIQISELLPRLAQRMDRLAVIRSVNHLQSSHNAGMHWSTVGKPYRIDSTLINPSPVDHPSFGTLVGWLAQRDGYTGSVPPYVITPYPHCDSTVYLTPGQFGGCLGVRFDPYVLDADPNAANFRVRNLSLQEGMTAGRFEERMSLLTAMDHKAMQIRNQTAASHDAFHSRAASMVLSGGASRAFDLTQESTETRDRYGRHSWGQSHLLARRLIEAGSRFVTTVNGRSIIWDTHKNNFVRMEKDLVPPMEQGFVALLDDLEQRNMLDSTLVVWLGDFGRTPIINKDAGRDHWPQCYSAVLAGGGIKGGIVVGASDKTGAFPHSRPVSPGDIHATVFSSLGYDPHGIQYHMADGRPFPLSDGDVIRELV
jgi:hypothetical protein